MGPGEDLTVAQNNRVDTILLAGASANPWAPIVSSRWQSLRNQGSSTCLRKWCRAHADLALGVESGKTSLKTSAPPHHIVPLWFIRQGDASQGNLEIKSDSTEKTSNSGSKEAASKKVGRGLPMGGVHPRWRQLPDHSPYGRSKKPRTLTSSLFLALSQLIFWFAIHLIIGRPNGQSLAVARPPRLVVRRRKLAATAR